MSEPIEHLGEPEVDIQAKANAEFELLKKQHFLNELSKEPLTIIPEADIEQMRQQLGHALPPQSISADVVHKEPVHNSASSALTIKVADLLKSQGFVQVGPDSYEIVTPGYEPQPEPHQHTFQFLMNANHNALRGCTTCGATWVGYMAGGPDTLRWHPVAEIEEE